MNDGVWIGGMMISSPLLTRDDRARIGNDKLVAHAPCGGAPFLPRLQSVGSLALSCVFSAESRGRDPPRGRWALRRFLYHSPMIWPFRSWSPLTRSPSPGTPARARPRDAASGRPGAGGRSRTAWRRPPARNDHAGVLCAATSPSPCGRRAPRPPARRGCRLPCGSAPLACPGRARATR